MIIHQTRDGSTLTITPEGRLDTVSSPEMEAVLDKIDPAVTDMVLDMGKLDYISSAGIRVVLRAQQEMDSRNGLVIRNANELIMEIFTVTGLTSILNFE